MPNELIPVRLSHVLGQSGVGAIVREKDYLVVIQDTRHWTNRQGQPAGKLIPYVERVRAALGISQELREPPVAKELTNGQIDGICVPATRFPSWMRCPRCNALYQRPWWGSQGEYINPCYCVKCENKPPRLEQVTWVLVDSRGYLADVPWHCLVHSDADAPNQQNCKIRDQLQLIEHGYEQRILRCTACDAETQFHGDERRPFCQQRMQPWTRDDITSPDIAVHGNTDEGKQSLAQVLAINDARVYSPAVVSVLIIPPESRVRKGTVVDLLYRNSTERKKIDNARTPLARKAAIRTLATDYRCQPQDIEAALSDLDRGYPLYGKNLMPEQLRESEFEAFLEVLPDQRDDEDLVTHNRTNEWHALETDDNLSIETKTMVHCVQHLVRVDRLKAVKVFRGFTRLDGKEIVPPDIVGQSGWLPAIELYGEGILLRWMKADWVGGNNTKQCLRDWRSCSFDLLNLGAMNPIR